MEGVACVAVLEREEERERGEGEPALGLCAWKLFFGRLCPVESTEKGVLLPLRYYL